MQMERRHRLRKLSIDAAYRRQRNRRGSRQSRTNHFPEPPTAFTYLGFRSNGEVPFVPNGGSMIHKDTTWVQSAGLALLLSAAVVSGSEGLAQPNAPVATSLRTGDFLWPKLPGKVVPYNSRPGEAATSDAQQWNTDRRAELSRLETLVSPTVEENERYRLLSGMNYQAFQTQYLTSYPAGAILSYGTIGAVATGHVAIVDVRETTPWIIEAMLTGVREITYKDWLEGRPGELVWHGRLKGASDAQRNAIAATARAKLATPYRFFNFDLADDTGFYCSKLAWFSVWKATGRALDDNLATHRALWFSPKQMLHSKQLEVLFSPGPY